MYIRIASSSIEILAAFNRKCYDLSETFVVVPSSETSNTDFSRAMAKSSFTEGDPLLKLTVFIAGLSFLL